MNSSIFMTVGAKMKCASTPTITQVGIVGTRSVLYAKSKLTWRAMLNTDKTYSQYKNKMQSMQ